MGGYEYHGKTTWEIRQKEINNNSIIYNVQRVLDAIKIGIGMDNGDTTYLSPDTTYFDIEEDSNHIIQIKHFPFNWYQGTYLFLPFQRYQPIRIGETLTVDEWAQYKFAKKIGMSYFFWDIGSTNNPSGWRLRLLNYNIK